MRKLEKYVYYLLLFCLPFQIGKHFWPQFSYVSGFRLDYLSPTLYLTDVLIAVLFIFTVLNGKLKLAAKDYKYPIILLTLLVIGILRSENLWGGAYGLIKLLEMGFFGWYTFGYFKTYNTKTVSKIFSAGIIIQTSIAFFQFYLQRNIGSLFYLLGERSFTASTPGIANFSLHGNLVLRPYGTLPHPNVLAGYLVIFLIFILFGKKNLFERIALLGGTFGILLTFSRIALLVWFGVIVWYEAKQIKKTPGKYLLGILIILISFFLLTPQGSRVLQTNLSDVSLTERVRLNSYATTLFTQHPLFGVGLNNFYNAVSKIWQPKDFGLLFYLQPVHNIYLLILSQTGIFVFLFILFGIINLLRKKFSPVLLAVLILGFFDHYFLTVQQGQLLLALAVATSCYV